MNNEVLVSIAMLTYNHEQYIREAIESVLIQNVDFKYEIIVGDDASNDNTQTILKEYQSKYPDKINLILRESNVGPTKNLYDILMLCQGKYIALLEGDDFWSDKNKLEMQTNYLEKNTNYVGVSHSCNIFNQEKKVYKNSGTYFYENNHDYGFDDFKYIQFPGHTSTFFFKNIFLDREKDYSIIYTADRNTADRTIVLLLVLEGKIFCIGKTMSTYREVRAVGASNVNSLYLNKNMHWIQFKYLLALDEYSKKISGNTCLSQKIIDSHIIAAYATYLKIRTKDNRKIFEKLYLYKKHSYLYYLFFTIVGTCKIEIKKFVKHKLSLILHK